MPYNFDAKQTHGAQRAHISKVPASTFVCHNSARAENCKTYTFHDHEHNLNAQKRVCFWRSRLIKLEVSHIQWRLSAFPLFLMTSANLWISQFQNPQRSCIWFQSSMTIYDSMTFLHLSIEHLEVTFFSETPLNIQTNQHHSMLHTVFVYTRIIIKGSLDAKVPSYEVLKLPWISVESQFSRVTVQ